jgi:hypothetical protein
MKSAGRKSPLHKCMRCIVCVAMLAPLLVAAQSVFGVRTTPGAQRNALNTVQSQVKWLHNATRTAPNLRAQGYGNIRQQFDALRSAYSGLKNTLTSQQLAYGAYDLAELDAGLDILQGAFSNYEQDIAEGQPLGPALQKLCQAVRQGSDLWLQELKRKAARLRIGAGVMVWRRTLRLADAVLNPAWRCFECMKFRPDIIITEA